MSLGQFEIARVYVWKLGNFFFFLYIYIYQSMFHTPASSSFGLSSQVSVAAGHVEGLCVCLHGN